MTGVRSERPWSLWEGDQASSECHGKPFKGFKQEGDEITVLRCSGERALRPLRQGREQSWGRAGGEMCPDVGKTPGWVSGVAVWVGCAPPDGDTAGRGWRGRREWPVLPALILSAMGVKVIPGTLKPQCPQVQTSVHWNSVLI